MLQNASNSLESSRNELTLMKTVKDEAVLDIHTLDKRIGAPPGLNVTGNKKLPYSKTGHTALLFVLLHK